MAGWTEYFEELSLFLQDIERNSETRSETFVEYVLERIPTCLRVIRQVAVILADNIDNDDGFEDISLYSDALQELFDSLCAIHHEWTDRLNYLLVNPSSGFASSVIHAAGVRGRPKFDITESQLLYLSSLSFSWKQIASLLGVSRMTVYRRRIEFNMVGFGTPITSDTDLRELVIQLKGDLPYAGEVLLMGQLRARGFYVTRARLRAAIRDIDPLNTAMRVPAGLLPRRPYNVPGPNSLWHIDGHHKLVRWNFVTHAGIDGYSRKIVYMHCSTNNRADTVYSLFLDAVSQCGLPSRVRSDYGGENVRVAQHMLVHRGMDRNSMITGNSTHNQRIERLWRDLYQTVIQLYYRLFYHLEHLGLLDTTNQVDLYALHYVFLPRINKAIEAFKFGWNSHGIRTEHNMSPNQLFAEGALRLQRSGLVALDFFQNIDELYGTEDDDYIVTDTLLEMNRVQIMQSNFSLDEDSYARLVQLIDPLSESSNYGIDLYEQTMQYVMHTINNPQVLDEA